MPFYRTIPKKKKSKKLGLDDKKLWTWFSLFIRLRDSNEEGYVQCFTCGVWRNYKGGDCGHGVGRQHWGTKYEPKNNHFQCKLCNGPGEGRKDLYCKKVDERYGKGTWDMLLFRSRQPFRLTQYEIDCMALFYKQEVEKLMLEKNLKP